MSRASLSRSVAVNRSRSANESRQLDIAVAEPGEHVDEPQEKGLPLVHALLAMARDRFQGGDVLLFGEAVLSCLGTEKVVIELLVLEEELPHEEITHMPSADHDRGDQVPHVVLAFVRPELSRRNTHGQDPCRFRWHLFRVSGWARWNFRQISCHPTSTSTRPLRSIMLILRPVLR